MYCITCKSVVEKQLKGEEAGKRIDIDDMTNHIILIQNSH